MRGIWVALAAAFTACLAGGNAAAQQSEENSGTALIHAVSACRSIGDAAERLACFDRAAATLAAAVSANDLVVMDRQDIRRTRRSLFGFSLPRLPFLGSRNEQEEEEAREITATVASVRDLGHSKWQIRLEDGAIWETTEPGAMLSEPRAGSTVVIRRGIMGNYMMRIDGQRGLRARREG